jgi:hypothetical protein
MIKFLISIILIITFTFIGCSDDKENGNLPSPAEKEILQVLDGKFVGSLYSPVTNTTETEEITFTPYSSAQEKVSVIDGRIVVYGTAHLVEYFNDHLLEMTENCYYSVSVNYSDAIISFYSYSESGEINGREDKRIISIESDNSFKMRKYGLAENNDKIFYKK